jgi:hypothetical protein
MCGLHPSPLHSSSSSRARMQLQQQQLEGPLLLEVKPDAMLPLPKPTGQTSTLCPL